MEDDDDFLYGDDESRPQQTSHQQPPPFIAPAAQPISTGSPFTPDEERISEPVPQVSMKDESEEEGAEIEDTVSVNESEEDDDIEFIMEPTTRSLDFRQTRPGQPPTVKPPNASGPIKAPQPTLTTEYTPRERNAPVRPSPSTSAQTGPSITPNITPSASLPQETQHQKTVPTDDAVDPSTLPPVTAPPSHPSINPQTTATLDGRMILDFDLAAMGDKSWRRPGSDISDWFNYGFDEISWEAYCYRRRDLGDLGAVLKTNVINFAGMQEDQLNALPIEVRQMVMSGANNLMNNANPAMMGGGVSVPGMNPIMDMNAMAAANMAMGMGMPGEMAMMQGANGMGMQEGGGVGMGGGMQGVAGVGQQGEQGMPMGMGDGFGQGAGGTMMGMGMGGDFGMQGGAYPEAVQQQMQQQMQQAQQGQQGNFGMDIQGAGRGAPFRGRASAAGMNPRGRGGGRGRGGPPPVTVRPASPLPPGVPTGPRNQNKYKDRDGNGAAVDGLDYGGTNKDSVRTSSGEPEERSSSRKRRSSPGLDDRGSKRR